MLIANRGEIAIRIARTAASMGIACVTVGSQDDVGALHIHRGAEARILSGVGPAAYLDIAQLIAVARDTGCDAVHPGYGFLSESAAFARACAEACLRFVGPTPQQLAQLGNKASARSLAVECGVPVLAGTAAATELAEAEAFMAAIGRPVMVKALAGGGGRGIRLVKEPAGLESAFARCRSEAERAFGDGRLYVEQALSDARHIEVQIVGDGNGRIINLGERDCTVQRRNQKLIEIAPSPHLPKTLAAKMHAAADRMAGAMKYANAGTFEFLVDLARHEFFFLEVNPRLQVEHTVTEELWGVDLVEVQLRIADGASFAELGLERLAPRRGFALQARISLERLMADGTPVIDGKTLDAFESAGGPGIRVDACGYGGYTVNPRFDSLIAKLIVSDTAQAFESVARKAERALSEFRIEGSASNIPMLRAILAHPLFVTAALTTRFVDDHLPELLEAADRLASNDQGVIPHSRAEVRGLETVTSPEPYETRDDLIAVPSPLAGMIVDLFIAVGDAIFAGQPLAVVEAMKMEHVISAPVSGSVDTIWAKRGAAVAAGQSLLSLVADGRAAAPAAEAIALDLGYIRPDLKEVLERRAATLDAHRPEAVARRRNKGARTARENVDAVCDPGSFVEYGPLVVAAQRRRRPLAELVSRTQADGVVVGFGAINGDEFMPAASQALIIAFDDTVLAGTIGEMAREKMKHAIASAYAARRPVVVFAEGGGGRAGDTDGRLDVTGWTMDVSTYYQLGRMSALAPLIGVISGRCFAANAGLLGCCDVIIATHGANLGVGGPSMIEGGRLGTFTPEDIGPMDVQTKNGVVDILVANEVEAAATARAYLAYFQGNRAAWTCADQRETRFVVPENRLRAYDVRRAIVLLADTDSVLELRRDFGVEIVTSLIRIEGRSIGVVANNPLHLGGAIGSEGADKASRFMRLCQAFGLPILTLCDTPGVMVGPEAEKAATVRKMGRLFVTGANLTVPIFTIVLRKAYGIGAELMAGGWFKAPRFVVSWPTGEFGGMNIEGNVKLAHAAELAAIADPEQRRQRFDALVAAMYETGRALSVATHFEIDDVIDPAESRRWIAMGMVTHLGRPPGSDKIVPYVDPW